MIHSPIRGFPIFYPFRTCFLSYGTHRNASDAIRQRWFKGLSRWPAAKRHVNMLAGHDPWLCNHFISLQYLGGSSENSHAIPIFNFFFSPCWNDHFHRQESESEERWPGLAIPGDDEIVWDIPRDWYSNWVYGGIFKLGIGWQLISSLIYLV